MKVRSTLAVAAFSMSAALSATLYATSTQALAIADATVDFRPGSFASPAISHEQVRPGTETATHNQLVEVFPRNPQALLDGANGAQAVVSNMNALLGGTSGVRSNFWELAWRYQGQSQSADLVNLSSSATVRGAGLFEFKNLKADRLVSRNIFLHSWLENRDKMH